MYGLSRTASQKKENQEPRADTAWGSDPTDQSATLQYLHGARLVTVTGFIEKPSDAVR